MKKIFLRLVGLFMILSNTLIYANNNEKEFINKYIILAVKKGETNTVQMLLQQGADVNAKDDRGNTLLMMAITMDYQDIFELLLSKGADTTVRDAGGRTPLLLALFMDKIEYVKFFFNKGYIKGINIKDNTGKTPLMVAVAKGYADIVTQLIELGANTKDADNDGLTPLMYAVKLNYVDIAQIILQKENSTQPLSTNNNLSEGIALGSYIGDGETIKNIIEKKGKITPNEEYKVVIIARNIFLKRVK